MTMFSSNDHNNSIDHEGCVWARRIVRERRQYGLLNVWFHIYVVTTAFDSVCEPLIEGGKKTKNVEFEVFGFDAELVLACLCPGFARR